MMASDLLVAAAKLRTVLVSGFLAGICVFFAPLVVLALGLLAAYLHYVASDASSPMFGLEHPPEAADFRAVFAPAINSPALLVIAGVFGSLLAAFRRLLARRADPALLAAGIRPFFPEFAASYLLLTLYTLGLAFAAGGWWQVHRLATAAPVFLLFLVCATWLVHAVWQYGFRNAIELLASPPERDAAAALRAQRPASRQVRHAP
jgi:hypothetical protein